MDRRRRRRANRRPRSWHWSWIRSWLSCWIRNWRPCRKSSWPWGRLRGRMRSRPRRRIMGWRVRRLTRWRRGRTRRWVWCRFECRLRCRFSSEGEIRVIRIRVVTVTEHQFSSFFGHLLSLLVGGIRSLTMIKKDSQGEQSNDVERPHGGSIILVEFVTQLIMQLLQYYYETSKKILVTE